MGLLLSSVTSRISTKISLRVNNDIQAEVFDRLDIHSGTVFNYHQERMQSKNYLADLELLQYDLMYGEQYVYEQYGSTITEEHMVMGVKDAEISELVVQYDGTYSIYGANFTKQSKVYINDEKQKRYIPK